MNENKLENARRALLTARQDAQKLRRTAMRLDAGVFVALLTPTLQFIFNGGRHPGELVVLAVIAFGVSCYFLGLASRKEEMAIEADLYAEIAETAFQKCYNESKRG